MYRLTYINGQWYGLEIGTVGRDAPHIQEFADDGEIVIICKSIADLREIGILVGDIVF